MKTYYNNIKLVGRINTPIIKVLENGKKRAEFLIRTEVPFINYEGQEMIEDTWHQCLAWDKNATILDKHADTGSILGIEGILVSITSTEKNKAFLNAFVQVQDLLLLDEPTTK